MDAHIAFTEPTATTRLDSDLSHLVRHTLQRSIAGEGKIAPEVLAIPGMSGRKYRFFINNLIEQLPKPRYLEVGSWAGSTLCSAIAGNDVDAIAIDNWSLFGGPSAQFFKHLSLFKGKARVSFLEQDYRIIDYASLGRTFGLSGVYLFDGPHGYQDQYDGIKVAQAALEPRYIQIVDDWNWPAVRNGTLAAIKEIGLRIEFMAEIRTSLDNRQAPETGRTSDWHNGYCISVLSRPL